MRIDWLPYSASALVAGATALAVGTLLMPQTDDSAESFQVVAQQDARWLAVAGLYFAAAVAMTVGLPAVLTLLERRTARLGLTAVGVFAVGCIGIAGYAMLLAFYHALVNTRAIDASSVEQVTQDAGLGVFLFGWIGAFYLGELLLGIALLRTRGVARWIPALLIAHVAVLPVSQALPGRLSSAAVLLVTIAFAGLGITANNRHLVVTG